MTLASAASSFGWSSASPISFATTAISGSRIPRVVMGENRTFVGGEDYMRTRGVEVVNLDSQECLELMAGFIAEHPELWNEDIGRD